VLRSRPKSGVCHVHCWQSALRPRGEFEVCPRSKRRSGAFRNSQGCFINTQTSDFEAPGPSSVGAESSNVFRCVKRPRKAFENLTRVRSARVLEVQMFGRAVRSISKLVFSSLGPCWWLPPGVSRRHLEFVPRALGGGGFQNGRQTDTRTGRSVYLVCP
jgi:hypothetical protein